MARWMNLAEGATHFSLIFPGAAHSRRDSVTLIIADARSFPVQDGSFTRASGSLPAPLHWSWSWSLSCPASLGLAVLKREHEIVYLLILVHNSLSFHGFHGSFRA